MVLVTTESSIVANMMESEDTSIKSGLLNEDDRLDGMVLGGLALAR